MSGAAHKPEIAHTVSGDYRLRDITREPAPNPCPDCGMTYLNGENVTMTAPTLPTGTRVVWSGCCDCWERRTRPEPECVRTASCETDDHTYSWPCALAEYPKEADRG